jgi:hypothetical protein
LCNTSSTHPAQNVHSKEQIRASADSGGSSLLQFSQLGLNWSIVTLSMVVRYMKNAADQRGVQF